MPKLVCTHGSDAENVYALKEGALRIGRSPHVAVKLSDKACSREHAEVFCRGDYISIEDLGSRHGTFVNGKRITRRTRVYVGDRLDIGHTVFKVCEGESGEIQRVPPEVPTSQVNTQEISERLLAAELDLVKMRQQHPKVNLFRRLFGSEGGEGGEGGKDPEN